MRVWLGVLFIAMVMRAGVCTATEEIKKEVETTIKLETDVAGILNGINEVSRAHYGAVPYSEYRDEKTGFRIVRADDKVFVEHPAKGRYFIKSADFWAKSINRDAVIMLSNQCQFPPTIPKRQAQCPAGSATCPQKEEADCDRHSRIMSKLVQNGFLTKDKFDCLDKFLKPKHLSLSYICLFNPIRSILNPLPPTSSTSKQTSSYPHTHDGIDKSDLHHLHTTTRRGSIVN